MSTPIIPAPDLSAWRKNREPQWYRDIGYTLQGILLNHQYNYKDKGKKPDDPGWHRCTCGWEGYWSDFQPHVADQLRAVIPAIENTQTPTKESQAS